ncbi:S8 family serine peptidase [Kaistia algarum]|uniref:S8 family serine peptidase n=1 Tax=Kaistia algarum TaxID=2083279 RepID=UPI0014021C77|nr:S8 family serine peptidase [Kaistia algarum]MCX5512987.1 S8 family serine peptidase [Kaistia algarum]
MTKKLKLDWVVVKRVPATSGPLHQNIVVNSNPTFRGPGASSAGADASFDNAIPISQSTGSVSYDITTATMTRDEAAEQRRKVDVVDAVMKMPLILIQALDTGGAGADLGDEAVAWGVTDIGADTSPWDGKGVTVAVLDTGIEADHPAFTGVTLKCCNFTDEPDEDQSGHGTHCAGTIFGRDVNEQRIGIARGVAKALIGKIFGKDKPADTDTIVRALAWAQSERADVISMSMGIDFPAYREALMKEYELPDRQATALALDAYLANMRLFDNLSRAALGAPPFTMGNIVVCASGNESDMPNYSISASPPSRAAEFVSVAALDRPVDGKPRLAPFSNVGAKLAAPGVGILSAWLGHSLKRLDGTSMATPHVAGATCLWLQKQRLQGNPAHAEAVVGQMRQNATSLLPDIRQEDVLWGAVRAPNN